MKEFIKIYIIDNGYLVVELDGNGDTFRSAYLKDISWSQLLSLDDIDHEAIIRGIVHSAPGKIEAIKAVRVYIRKHTLDRSDGLKDVKDYVESVRSDWPTL